MLDTQIVESLPATAARSSTSAHDLKCAVSEAVTREPFDITEFLGAMKQLPRVEYLMAQDARVLEEYTIEEHTSMVIGQYLVHGEEVLLPHPLTKDEFIIGLTVHDIGKSIPAEKSDQHAHTLQVMEALRDYLPVSDKSWVILKTIIGNDLLGKYIRPASIKAPSKETRLEWHAKADAAPLSVAQIGEFAGLTEVSPGKASEKAAECAAKITALAESVQLRPRELLNLMLLYYICDTSAYTSEAVTPSGRRARPGLDYLYEHNPHYDAAAGSSLLVQDVRRSLPKFSPRIASVVDALEREVADQEAQTGRAARVSASRFSLDLLNQGRPLVRDKVMGMLQSLSCGDALGVPVETWCAESITEYHGRIEELKDPSKHKWFRGAPLGSISDDAQLSLAVARAIQGRGPLSIARLAEEHVSAAQESTQGWGSSTLFAVARLGFGASPQESALGYKNAGRGNGVVMKIAALAAWAACTDRSEAEIEGTVVELAAMTHRTSLAVSSALAHTFGLLYCLQRSPEEFSKEEFLEVVTHYSERGRAYFPETQNGDDLTKRLGTIDKMLAASREEVIAAFGAGTFYVYNSLPFSYTFFLKNPYSIEAMYETVNAGGDTDSNASIVGALLGALHGTSITPQHIWNKLPARQRVASEAAALAERLEV